RLGDLGKGLGGNQPLPLGRLDLGLQIIDADRIDGLLLGQATEPCDRLLGLLQCVLPVFCWERGGARVRRCELALIDESLTEDPEYFAWVGCLFDSMAEADQ